MDFLDLAQATAAVDDPATSGQDLADIAQAQPDLRAQIAAHPNTYPGLLDWLEQYGDDVVKQAVRERRAGGAGEVPFVPSSPAMTGYAPTASGPKRVWWIPAIAGTVALLLVVGIGVAIFTYSKRPGVQPSVPLPVSVTVTVITDTATAPVTETDTETQPAKTSGYTLYTNSRYGYTIEYPSNFVVAQVSDNGDGRVFTSANGAAVLTVYAGYNVMGATVSSQYSQLDKPSSIPFSRKGSDYFIASWYDGDQIVYHKEFVQSDIITVMDFRYPTAQRAKYDKIVTYMEKHFTRPE